VGFDRGRRDRARINANKIEYPRKDGAARVGKTHLANAIAQMACLRGTRVRFTTAADLVNDLVAAQARNALHKRLALWTVPQLLVVDELGYLSFDARGADLLYQVFNRR
jgi:DNA replication protein DnaC